MTYTPDAWVLIQTPEGVKVLAGWRGGYLDGDQWRLSSGVTQVQDADNHWIMTNHSGSVYRCGKEFEGLISVMAGMYETLTQNGCKGIQVQDYVNTN